jgi:hypothetical protein
MLEKARDLVAGILKKDNADNEKCVNLSKALGVIDCRVALYLTNLEKKGFEGRQFASLQAIADAFIEEIQKFATMKLELEVGHIESKQAQKASQPHAQGAVAVSQQVQVPASAATPSAADLSSMAYIVKQKSLRVGVYVHEKGISDIAWEIQALNDDFCALMKYEFDKLAENSETRSVTTTALFESCAIHTKKLQVKVRQNGSVWIAFLNNIRANTTIEMQHKHTHTHRHTMPNYK